MVIVIDKTLIKYRLLVTLAKIFGALPYQYKWYESAAKVRRQTILESEPKAI
jgi:hypothetical protein